MQRIALKNLGLRDSEINVYLALLNLGTAGVSEIAKKAGMYNKNTYDALKRLNELGLASKATEEKKLVFHAEDPEKLFWMWESRKDHLTAVIPELTKIYRQAPSEEEIFTYKGRTGLKSVFEDVLKSDRCMEMGDIVKFKEYVQNYYMKYQFRKRERKMRCKTIITSSMSQTNKNKLTREIWGGVRFIDRDYPSLIVIYSNKVAFIHFGEEIFETIVKSNILYERYSNYFNNI